MYKLMRTPALVNAKKQPRPLEKRTNCQPFAEFPCGFITFGYFVLGIVLSTEFAWKFIAIHYWSLLQYLKQKTALGFPKRFYLCFVFSFGLLGFFELSMSLERKSEVLCSALHSIV
ncbi:MAG: hypothetical protein IJY13_04810 [Clostridia bacterium]|nr:hypothetical protein [Clostridia bacterium]